MLKCASFFAGVGGIDLGFEETGFFKTIYANEFDPYPVKTYEENFDLKVDCRDIRNVKISEIPDFDVMLAGFPCQAFSIAGQRQGFEDKKGRGVLFFELVRIIKNKNPQIIFLENVKNLVGHDNGNTFLVIINELKKQGYYIKYAVLNAMEYGNIPQNRERIYIVAFKNKEQWKNFEFPLPIKLTTKLSDIINFKGKYEEKYYYTKGKYKGNLYEKLVEAMDDDFAIYQCEGGHNVCIIKTKYGIRKMTPHECFNTQGFSKDFKLPKNMSDAKLYKQAGNSVCVSVIKRIAEEIVKSCQDNLIPNNQIDKELVAV